MSAAVLQSCAAGPTAAEVGRRLRACLVGVRVDQEPIAACGPGVVVVPASPSGVSIRSASASRPGAAPQPADELAEQRHAEVRVVVAAARRAAPARPGPARRAARRRPARAGVPDVAVRLALQAGGVRQQPADRQLAVRRQVQVPADRVVEVQQAVVAALEGQHRGEGLGDRADPEPGVRPQRAVGAGRADGAASRAGGRPGAGPPTPPAPGRRPGPAGPAAQAIVGGRRSRRSRASIGPSGAPPSTCACTWNTSWPPYAPVLNISRKPSPSSPSSSATAAAVGQHLGGQRRVALGERRDVGVVLLRDDQDVHRRLRVDVAEGERGVGLPDHGGRDLPGDDAAEQAVGSHRGSVRIRAVGAPVAEGPLPRTGVG